MNDFRAVSLPDEIQQGLVLLTRRVLLCDATRTVDTLGNDMLSEAGRLVRTLFGEAPVFGMLTDCIADDVRSACTRVGIEPSSELSPRAFVRLLKSVTPSITVCPNCGEFALNDVGGQRQILAAGYRCPFCAQALVRVIPMTLRQLAWTDGRLVEPGTTDDVMARRGSNYPLQDADIIRWTGNPHPELMQMLSENDLPVYGLLAYLNLCLRKFVKLDEARDFLNDPHSFGVTERSQVMELIRFAAAFLVEREVTNITAPPGVLRSGHDLANMTRIAVGGSSYLLEGRIGSGDKCEVYRAIRDTQPAELVVLKVLRALDDADLLARECDVLRSLQQVDDPGTYFFSTLVPQVAAFGQYRGDDRMERSVLALRYSNRFDWSLADAMQEYPHGIDPAHAVWIWNRAIDFLQWLHRIGRVHGAILPPHIMLQTGNHAVMLIDWAYSVQTGQGEDSRIGAMSNDYDDYYLPTVFDRRPATPDFDIAMLARTMIAAVGGDPAFGTVPDSVPKELVRIWVREARYDDRKFVTDIARLKDEFKAAARQAFGPPKFVKLVMPAMQATPDNDRL